MPQLSTVTLPGTDITTTRIGFGCSGLLGGATREEAHALLQAAYDSGVRHFDVARYYGYGDAEGVLGSFLKGKRAEVTITTKFGIQPNQQLVQARGLITLVRRLMRASPLLRSIVRRKVRSVVTPHQFDVGTARQSLETSLRELGTETIDIYLLHEPSPDDCRSDDLLEFLQDAAAAGKIRAFGIGAGFERARAICADAPAFSRVVQTNSTAGDENIEALKQQCGLLPDGRPRAFSAYGTFAGRDWFAQQAQSNPEFAGLCRRLLGFDCADPQQLSRFLVQKAISDNAEGLVLFRTSSPKHIKEIAQYTAEPFRLQAEWARFKQMLNG